MDETNFSTGEKMDRDVKIIKPPSALDVNDLIFKEIKKKNMVCPFCGENRKYDFIRQMSDRSKIYGVESSCIYSESWYGKQNHTWYSMFKFWESNHLWKRSGFECHTCGAKWLSEPYPTDIKIEL